ncbi:hypothetical protein CLOM_g11571 [Closterium sp. NIES-68]|nr:hypothetical protein CLOM_g11571 [Closterium sp. NIES-68]GJP64942.1 hypothetical protein CLOP_g21875 [Closterium sp. NIES-67]
MATAYETGDSSRHSPTGEKLLPVTTRASTPRAAPADPWRLLRWGKYCGSGGGEVTRVALHTLPFVLLLALIAVASTFARGGFSQQPFRQSLTFPLSVSKMSSPSTTTATLAVFSAGDLAGFDGASSKLGDQEESVFGRFADPAAGGAVSAESLESAQRAEVAEAESAEAGVTESSTREAVKKEGSLSLKRDESVADVTVGKEKEERTGSPGKGKQGKGTERTARRPSDTNEGATREAAADGVAPIVELAVELPSESPAGNESTVGEAFTGGKASAVGEASGGAAEDEQAMRGDGGLSLVAVTEGDLPSRLGTLCAAPSIAAVLAARNAAQQAQTEQGQLGQHAQRIAVLWKGGEELFGGLPGRGEIREWLAREGAVKGKRGGGQEEKEEERGKGEQQQQQQQQVLLQGVVDSWPELKLSDKESAESEMGGMTEIEFALPLCASSASMQPPSSLKLWARREVGTVAAGGSGKIELSPHDSCLVTSLKAACLGALHPSPTVAAIMLAHPPSALAALPRSTAVYLEAGAARAGAHPGAGCQEDSPRNATLRSLAWRYLRAGSPSAASSSSSSSSPSSSSSSSSPSEPSPPSDFTIAAYEPSDAEFVASTFHPLRAPRILPVTALRLAFCSALDLSPAAAPVVPAQAKAGAEAAAVAATAQAQSEMDIDLSVMKGRVESGEWSCLQLQMAEAWVLSAARGLIHTHASLEARFMAAQATAGTARRILAGATGGGADAEGAGGAAEGAEAAGRKDSGSIRTSFVVEPSVCEAPPAESLKGVAQRFLRQFIVDESLKTIYCFVPKVACTSWKTWFRQQQRGQGQKNISDVYLTHDHYKSGLRILAYHYNEYEVIRLLTRPDFFKFSFIRNPYARLASVYFNKHVNGGPPFGRQFWNNMFFRGITPYRRLVEQQGGKDLFGFSDFAYLLRSVEERLRSYMESHVQPQMDVCRFDAIKFDFIGRFENLDADVAEVLHRLNKTDASGAFSIGLNAHRTNAEDKLASLYDERAFDDASHLYASDFNIPLNNIAYDVPEGLARKFRMTVSES